MSNDVTGGPATGRGRDGSRQLTAWRRYAGAVLLVGLGTLVGGVLHGFLAPVNLVMIFLAVVVIAAQYLGRGPAAASAVLGVLAFDFFFVPPYWTLAVSQVEYLFTFLGLLLVGLLISDLTARVQEQLEATRQRERDTAALYSFTRALAVAVDQDSVLHAVDSQGYGTFGRRPAVLLLAADGSGALEMHSHGGTVALDGVEIAAAKQALATAVAAGRGTEYASEAELRYLPLATARGALGVLGVWPATARRSITAEQLRLMEAFASLAAVAIERVRLVDAAGQVQVLRAAEQLQSALLNSVSHDLRTPLASITGALSSLLDQRAVLDEQARQVLLQTAADEAGRLNRLVGNLLDMTRLEAGAVTVRRRPSDLQDVVGSALEQLSERLAGRPVETDIAADLPLVPLDPALVVHVLVNLIDNAIKYSPDGSPIRVATGIEGNDVRFEVEDRGVGIPEGELEQVFDKFYRIQRHGDIAGTGLGLSISRGLVEAHGGRIRAGNRPGGGTSITVTIPAGAER